MLILWVQNLHFHQDVNLCIFSSFIYLSNSYAARRYVVCRNRSRTVLLNTVLNAVGSLNFSVPNIWRVFSTVNFEPCDQQYKCPVQTLGTAR
jgi:hypothetical protein